MTDDDLDAFTSEVRRVATIFRFRASPLELTQVTRAYFKAFRRRPLAAVTAGADAWIGKGQRFPKPFEWLDAMPRPGAEVETPLMGQVEAEEWARAERLRWEDAPCGCVACVAAGVTDRPLRYVPETDEQDRDRHVFNSVLGRIVTSGHWAHGHELNRWYASREDFYRRFRVWAAQQSMVPDAKKQRRHNFKERIAAIFAKRPPVAPVVEREPGQEG